MGLQTLGVVKFQFNVVWSLVFAPRFHHGYAGGTARRKETVACSCRIRRQPGEFLHVAR